MEEKPAVAGTRPSITVLSRCIITSSHAAGRATGTAITC